MAPYIQKTSLVFFLVWNVGILVAAQGTQFITGPCKSDTDCASACCGFNTGLCAGPVIAQERDGGCGFGDATPNDTAARAFLGQKSASVAAAAPAPAPAPTAAASAKGTQFITGPCKSDSDCASSCCGFKSGKCAGPVIAQERDGGCGFGDATPNDTAARAFLGQKSAPAAAAAPVPAPAPAPAAAAPAKGTQFITGPCKSDGDCASSCCGFKSGKCAGPVIAQERDGGCGFGDATPNDTAARAFFAQQSASAAAAAAPVAAPAATTLVTVAKPAPSAAAGSGSGKPLGAQFITGPCASDAECASACCGFKSGKCAGPIIAQERDGGCGFGDAQPNDRAAQALRGN